MLDERVEKVIKKAIEILKDNYDMIEETNYYDEPERGTIIDDVEDAGHTMKMVANILRELLD